MAADYRASSLLLLALAVACWSFGGGRAEKGVSVEPSQKPKPAVKERLACHHGIVRRGQIDGSIDFQVRCRPLASSERIGFSVSRGYLDSVKRAPIRSFSRHPVLMDGKAPARYGSCRRDRSGPASNLTCEARADRSALIEGRLWVRASEVCASNIWLTASPKRPPCRRACALDYTVVILAEGAPRLC